MGLSGRRYDSGAERDRADELRLLQEAGAIRDLREQERIELLPSVFYKPDFRYLEIRPPRIRDDPPELWAVTEDVKGVELERFRLIKKIWKLVGPTELRVLKREGRKREFRVVESIPPGIHVLRRMGDE